MSAKGRSSSTLMGLVGNIPRTPGPGPLTEPTPTMSRPLWHTMGSMALRMKRKLFPVLSSSQT
eukprot:11234229-Karenia_brevis.AAC.1